MKKTLGIAVMNFFGTAALIGLFDLLATRFNFEAFMQIASRPAHIVFVIALGLILAAGAFFRPQIQDRHSAAMA